VLPRLPCRVRRQGQELVAAPSCRWVRGGGHITGRGGGVLAGRGDNGGDDGAVGGLHVRMLRERHVLFFLESSGHYTPAYIDIRRNRVLSIRGAVRQLTEEHRLSQWFITKRT
jgi:hypothetical protein